jgi:hypothetical protein
MKSFRVALLVILLWWARPHAKWETVPFVGCHAGGQTGAPSYPSCGIHGGVTFGGGSFNTNQ